MANWDFGREHGLIEAISATKSIVNLAIGRLIDQGKIKSIDQPVHEFFPEWNQRRKKLVTIHCQDTDGRRRFSDLPND